MHIGLSVLHHSVRQPSHIAVEDVTGKSLSYLELELRSNRLAHFLQNKGVRPGDRVAYFMANRIEIVEILVAIAKCGAIAAPLNFRLSEQDLRGILENAQPVVVLVETNYFAVAQDLSVDLGFTVVDIESEEPASHGGASHFPESAWQVGIHDAALIQYTSGTTGVPKGATFTHSAVLFHASSVALEYGIDKMSRVMVSIPHNSATNIQTIPSLYMGATLLLGEIRSLDGAEWLDRANNLAATHSQVVPTTLYRALEAGRATGVRLESMKALGYASAPIPASRVEELVEVFGHKFIQLYGMIEIAATGTMLRFEDHVTGMESRPELLASVGQPSYGIDVRIKDDSGKLVNGDGRGEVVFKGPYVMSHYWNNPERTAESLIDGWMHSGDVGEIRDGWLYLVDRIKDIIIRGGQNIASTEIESALYQHPGVLEAAAFALPSNDEWGESIAAAVVLKEGARATSEEICQAAISSGLERFKAPEKLVILDELPRNAIGKVQKHVLRKEFE